MRHFINARARERKPRPLRGKNVAIGFDTLRHFRRMNTSIHPKCRIVVVSQPYCSRVVHVSVTTISCRVVVVS